MRRPIVFLICLCTLAACSPRVDLSRAISVEPVTSGWNGTASAGPQTKIVPVVSFRVKNRSSQRLDALQINVVFHRVGEDAEWGTGFVPAVGAGGLPPGRDSDVLTVASPLGYTGMDAKPDLLNNSQFVDVAVRLFAKSGSGQWTPIGEFPVARRLVNGD